MLRAAGLPIILTAPLEVRLSISVTNGGVTHVLTGSYNSIPAGKYRPNDFVNLVDDAIRRWLVSRITAAGGVNVGSKDTKDLSFSLAEVAGANQAIMTIQFLNPSSTIGGTPTTFSAGTLDNSNGLWTKLGMMYPDETTTRAFTVASGQLTMVGRFQSKHFFIIERSEIDTGPKLKKHHSSIHRLDSGTVKRFKYGGSHYERLYSFVQQDLAVAGPPQTFGRCYQISSSSGVRNLIDFRNPNLGDISMGPNNPYFDPNLFVSGRYIDIGGFITRAFTVSSTQIRTSEAIPTSVSPSSTKGMTVRLVSELWALYLLAEDDIFYLYESDDMGDIIWVSDSYAIYGSDEPELSVDRPEAGVQLYDWQWNLIEVEDDNTLLVNIA